MPGCVRLPSHLLRRLPSGHAQPAEIQAAPRVGVLPRWIECASCRRRDGCQGHTAGGRSILHRQGQRDRGDGNAVRGRRARPRPRRAALQHLLHAVSRRDRQRQGHGRPARLSAAALVSRRAAARGGTWSFLRRDHAAASEPCPTIARRLRRAIAGRSSLTFARCSSRSAPRRRTFRAAIRRRCRGQRPAGSAGTSRHEYKRGASRRTGTRSTSAAGPDRGPGRPGGGRPWGVPESGSVFPVVAHRLSLRAGPVAGMPGAVDAAAPVGRAMGSRQPQDIRGGVANAAGGRSAVHPDSLRDAAAVPVGAIGSRADRSNTPAEGAVLERALLHRACGCLLRILVPVHVSPDQMVRRAGPRRGSDAGRFGAISNSQRARAAVPRADRQPGLRGLDHVARPALVFDDLRSPHGRQPGAVGVGIHDCRARAHRGVGSALRHACPPVTSTIWASCCLRS